MKYSSKRHTKRQLYLILTWTNQALQFTTLSIKGVTLIIIEINS